MRNKYAVAFLSIVTVIAIPTIVFILVAFGSGMSLTDTLTALTEQYISRRQNLLVCGLLGIFPLLLLGIILWLHSRFKGTDSHRPKLLLGGVIPILLVLLWANFEYWPDFLPARVYPGFPHGMELFLGPLFFAPVAMVIGVILMRMLLWRLP